MLSVGCLENTDVKRDFAGLILDTLKKGAIYPIKKYYFLCMLLILQIVEGISEPTWAL